MLYVSLIPPSQTYIRIGTVGFIIFCVEPLAAVAADQDAATASSEHDVCNHSFFSGRVEVTLNDDAFGFTTCASEDVDGVDGSIYNGPR